ncbi:MAG TPA: ferrochelatase [Planctomycetes bacterium]|nr:ferrochelatase [Planctomycetota bacterium]
MREEAWGILLVNLGTPDAPTPRAVRRYLVEFLMDPKVIDMPWILRALLVKGLIGPFRSPRTARAYRKIWTDEGSPLLVESRRLTQGLREQVTCPVALGMRYGRPSIADALADLAKEDLRTLMVVPLFPQYAEATVGSVREKVGRDNDRLARPFRLRFVPPFFDHPSYIKEQARLARPLLASLSPERVLISFHGLPERQIRRADATGLCLAREDCCDRPEGRLATCYRAQCVATARALAVALGLADARWRLSFQSRLGRAKWLSPSTIEEAERAARAGDRRLLVLSPSFVTDGLETLEELGLRLRETFRAAGGEDLRVVPCPSRDATWLRDVLRDGKERGEA